MQSVESCSAVVEAGATRSRLQEFLIYEIREYDMYSSGPVPRYGTFAWGIYCVQLNSCRMEESPRLCSFRLRVTLRYLYVSLVVPLACCNTAV